MRTHERTEITRNGTRAAVLLGADDYDSMLETLDILSDATLVAELQRSLNELAAGDVLTTDDVLADLPAGRRPREAQCRGWKSNTGPSATEQWSGAVGVAAVPEGNDVDVD